ncbi:Protein of unknown function [Spirosomataceae bacterium TFI 002]|nr:Protein of unknown function [Spirosomataceae bacterium TFI 002]
MENVLIPSGANVMISRINKLTPATQANWGKMKVAQMLAHCCVTYEMLFDDIHPKPNAIKKFFIKLFIKGVVVGPKPYKKNSPTAPEFKIAGEKDFEKEKSRLIAYMAKVTALGENHFEGLESHSFGPLTKTEWNTMFAKHLDHHLTQFGV